MLNQWSARKSTQPLETRANPIARAGDKIIDVDSTRRPMRNGSAEPGLVSITLSLFAVLDVLSECRQAPLTIVGKQLAIISPEPQHLGLVFEEGRDGVEAGSRSL